VIEVYTDGACRTNDGTAPASWAMAVYIDGVYRGKKSGVIPVGTNNQAELEGVIQALDWFSRHGHTDSDISILTDSAYVQNGCNSWLAGWVRKGWKTAAGGEVKNQAQWKQIHELLKKVPTNLLVKKVKGHSGNEGNDKADSICNTELDNYGV
jgi:ribonuclease HI